MPIRTIRKGAGKKAKQRHVGQVMHKLKSSATIAHTQRKFGKARARTQAVAIALKASRLSRRKKK